MAYTQGKYAKAMCDRCGDKIPYKSLKMEWTGYKVCGQCWDPKTKLEFPTRSGYVTDPETLRDPRPDRDKSAANGTVYAQDIVQGDTPVGSTFKEDTIAVALGSVTIVVT